MSSDMMTTSALSAYLLSIFVATAPLGRTRPALAAESPDEARARYTEIADAIAETVNESPPLFKGEKGRVRTALVMASVAYLESGLRKDVDLGLKKGFAGDCGLWQFNLGGGRTAEGWDCKELTSDRRKAARAALRMMNRSFNACAKYGPDALLRAFASGTCERGVHESKVRLELARRWEARFPHD